MTTNIKQFLVESKSLISSDDQVFLRHLYLPIIGPSTSMFYLTLVDKLEDNRAYKSIQDLLMINGMSFNSFSSARSTLEAIGLLETHLSSDEKTVIFRLVKPQSPEKFFDNQLLSKLLINKIGTFNYEQLEMKYKSRSFEKAEYHNISAKYHDVFDLNNKTDNMSTTAELPTLDIKSKEEALEKLSVALFIKYLTGDYPRASIIEKLNGFLSSGLSDASINLIIDYSFEVNGKIVFAHVQQIINSFTQVGSTHNFGSIKVELQNALNSKRSSIAEAEKTAPKANDSIFDEDTNDLFNMLRSL